MVMGKYYITTPIYYPNARPHIGTAYTTILADYLARVRRSLGDDVFFLTGTDEHGMKLSKAAKEKGLTPQQFVDQLADEFKVIWKELDISYDRFIRTTDEDHLKTVQDIILRCKENGDIYKGYYEGLYCVDCEQYYTEKDLVDGKCPIHGKPVEHLSMESYFFSLSSYQDKLLKFYEENPEFLPDRFATEVINRVKGGLRDISISRPKRYLDWGVEFPGDPEHVVYVWFDALTNYLTGVGYSTDKKMFGKYWPADVHLIGKDIIWFHCVIWPAMLMSAGLPLPKRVAANGFLTVNGQKISKSLGNVIDPVEIKNRFGTSDILRYYLLREIPFGSDGDFSLESVRERYNNELVNEFGNLVNRVLIMFGKYGREGSGVDEGLFEEFEGIVDRYLRHLEDLKLKQAVDTLWQTVSLANSYINRKEPWKLAKDNPEEAGRVVRTLAEYLVFLDAYLYPLLPEGTTRLAEHLGFDHPPKITELKPFGENLQPERIREGGLILYKRV